GQGDRLAELPRRRLLLLLQRPFGRRAADRHELRLGRLEVPVGFRLLEQCPAQQQRFVAPPVVPLRRRLRQPRPLPLLVPCLVLPPHDPRQVPPQRLVPPPPLVVGRRLAVRHRKRVRRDHPVESCSGVPADRHHQ